MLKIKEDLDWLYHFTSSYYPNKISLETMKFLKWLTESDIAKTYMEIWNAFDEEDK